MKRTIVIGAGLGGMSVVYELRQKLPSDHEVMLINEGSEFHFIPSNPWVALGERTKEQVVLELTPYVKKFNIPFNVSGVAHIDAKACRLKTGDGEEYHYDYLVICTGPKLAFEAVPGAGPENGFTQSICTVDHAVKSHQAYQQLVENPGPVIVGALQGASCFGPAYEYILSLESQLRKLKVRDRVPMTFVTSEPYVGHMGLGGVGDSKALMEHEFRERGIKWICNARTTHFEDGTAHIEELNRKGEVDFEHHLPFTMAMFLPPFKGAAPIAAVPELCNPKGFVLTDEYQRSPVYPEIFAAGVCVAIPPLEETPVPVGAPKTGFMIESMTTTIVENILSLEKGEQMHTKPTLNALCLADMGDKGAAFVALPQNPPRNTNWTGMGQWVHLAKIAFEKYFLYKVKKGTSEPIYEKYILKAAGIERTK
ncbi:pyridine nucleotide-disulfide oxidoreductase [Vibrio navarrensis]|uniref:Sulfide-quinone reductase n=1 Tax=Vibrio navarrensis TaxID=29495 RepID=A0AAJ4LU08_9VIBR|nr:MULTISPECIES: FAD/NAD(P)-binding oxidoreductase [Vibrio]KJR34149.1 pyridine nucleotide-disulfide oxidoreductase [Vibrio sp. S234-5]MBE3652602.1 pyridine nucleotide-disulfide oxidoreductase [Vibrio navarrensis]MBE3656361.1 pyridine nucleotide-disulfide oxidoreductase [Vibrio navarrensis]MBE3660899.1 pyridine nucleotide-disulfide oxidoreductase [Vibrio navarrensis]MBE4604194.1 pyridine nucleotide-disulfide oxidoreductase [Vibrio navarrensis]